MITNQKLDVGVSQLLPNRIHSFAHKICCLHIAHVMTTSHSVLPLFISSSNDHNNTNDDENGIEVTSVCFTPRHGAPREITVPLPEATQSEVYVDPFGFIVPLPLVTQSEVDVDPFDPQEIIVPLPAVTQSEVDIDPFDGVVATANPSNNNNNNNNNNILQKTEKMSCHEIFVVFLHLAFVGGYIWMIVDSVRNEMWFKFWFMVGVSWLLLVGSVFGGVKEYVKSNGVDENKLWCLMFFFNIFFIASALAFVGGWFWLMVSLAQTSNWMPFGVMVFSVSMCVLLAARSVTNEDLESNVVASEN